MRVTTALAAAALGLFAGCKDKPAPPSVTPEPSAPAAASSPVASAEPSAAPVVPDPPGPTTSCPVLGLSSWPKLEPGLDPKCHFHYADHPEAIELAARWASCGPGAPAGCQRLIPPGTDADLDEIRVDASRDPARLFLAWRCSSGHTALILDADGSPVRWAAASEEMGCRVHPVSIDGSTMMAMVEGVPDELEGGYPAATILFGQIDKLPPRVQHRVAHGSYIRELVADKDRWGNLAEDGLYLAKLGDDRTQRNGTRDSTGMLRLRGPYAVFRATSYSEHVEGWIGASDTPVYIGGSPYGASIQGLALGPGGNALWTEKKESRCTLARAPVQRGAPISRFVLPSCPENNAVWVASEKLAAVVLPGGQISVVRLEDSVAATLHFPCEAGKYCSLEAVAVNDKAIFAKANFGDRATLVRIPLPSFDGQKPLEAIPSKDDARDAGGEEAGAASAASGDAGTTDGGKGDAGKVDAGTADAGKGDAG